MKRVHAQKEGEDKLAVQYIFVVFKAVLQPYMADRIDGYNEIAGSLKQGVYTDKRLVIYTSLVVGLTNTYLDIAFLTRPITTIKIPPPPAAAPNSAGNPPPSIGPRN